MKCIFIIFVIGNICSNTTGYPIPPNQSTSTPLMVKYNISTPHVDEYKTTIQKPKMTCQLRSLGLIIFGKKCRNGTVNATTEIERADKISENITMRSANILTFSVDDYNPATYVAITVSLIGIAIVFPTVCLCFITSSSHPPLTVESLSLKIGTAD